MELSLGDVISLSTTFAARSDFSASEVSKLANMALTEVASRLHYKPKEAFAYSNIDGTGNERFVLLPTDFDGVVGVTYYSTSTTTLGVNVLGDQFELLAADTSVLDSFSSTSGTPVRYAIYGDNLELDPIPDSRGSLVMRYLAKQATLVALTDTPDLDERWHMGWLYKTLAHTCMARGDALGSNNANSNYVNHMTSTPNDRQQKQEDKYGMGLSVRKS